MAIVIDPVVVNVTPPGPRFRIPKLPASLTTRTSKLVTVGAAIVICASMVSFAIFTSITNKSSFKASHGITENKPKQPVNTSKLSSQAAPGGGIATGVGGTSGTNAPVITLTADPASVRVGGTSTLKWSVTNNPKECKATEDWSGDKSTKGGSEKTQSLSKAQTYLFTLTCKTDTGTGYSTVSVGAIDQGGTGSVATRPNVSIAANPTSLYVGDSSTITWSVSNNPTSCTASGDWSGDKGGSGSQGTGTLGVVKSYSYTLTCKNSAGTGYATATVQTINPPPGVPLVLLANSPVGPVTPGTQVTLSWTITNDTPTYCTATGDWSGSKLGKTSEKVTVSAYKTYIFTLTCGTPAGSTNDTSNVLVLPPAPQLTYTVTPSTMYTGNSATLNWNSNNDSLSQTTCRATGDWVSGTSQSPLSHSGSHNTGTLSPSVATNYNYTMTCSNARATESVTAILSVTIPPAPQFTFTPASSTVTSGTNSTTFSWSVTNGVPASCSLNGSGVAAPTGSQQATNLTVTNGQSSQVYTYNLTCGNAGGSSTKTSTITVSSGVAATQPPTVAISFAQSPIGTGQSGSLTWSVGNYDVSKTTCTASNNAGDGSWTGTKGAGGTVSTNTLGTANTYSYSLSCTTTGVAGTGSNSASIVVQNSPTVNTFTITSPVTSGTNAAASWTTSNATTCSASMSAGATFWSGSKGTSGSGATVTIPAGTTPGTYTLTLTCTNSAIPGASGGRTANITVNAPVGPTYCGGSTQCVGVAEMSSHNAPGNCWGWNSGTTAFPWVIDITGFRPNHPGGGKSGSLESAASTCNKNINGILNGSAAISGYTDKNNASTCGSSCHSSGTRNNTSGSGIGSAYRKGFYDASKP